MIVIGSSPVNLTPNEFSQTRAQTLNNLLGMSSVWLGASQRLADLLATFGGNTLYLGSKQLTQFGHCQLDAPSNFSTSLWLESCIRNTRLIDATFQILGEAQQSLMQSAEAQVRVIDEIVSASINRIANGGPWEVQFGVTAERSMPDSAEHTLHNLSQPATETRELAKNELHQISERLTESSPTTRPNRRSSKTAK